MPTPLPPGFQVLLDSRTAFRRVVRCVARRGQVAADVSRFVRGGSITEDARQGMRWSGALSLEIPEGSPLVPTRPGDLLTNFGTQITVELGVRRADGSSATVPCGVFMVSTAAVEVSSQARTVDLGLIDLAQVLERYRFEAPFTTPPGDLADVVNLVSADRLGSALGVFPTGAQVGERSFGLETTVGPWSELQEVVTGFGYRLWFDRQGIAVLDQQPDPVGAPTYVLSGATQASTAFDESPPNVAVVRGEPPDGTPVQAVEIDTNPGSPTWAGTTPGESPYGRSTEFFASPVIATSGQAATAAGALLAKSLGAGASWQVTLPWDPTIDPDDITRLPLPGLDSSVDVVVDARTVDLVGGGTTIIARGLNT